MRRLLIFIIVVLTATLVTTKPHNLFEDRLWKSDKELVELLKQILDSKFDEEREEAWKRHEVLVKRGFSLFARMRPFNSGIKDRTSIRNPFSPEGFMSAEKHANTFRPVGQPLRWG